MRMSGLVPHKASDIQLGGLETTPVGKERVGTAVLPGAVVDRETFLREVTF